MRALRAADGRNKRKKVKIENGDELEIDFTQSACVHACVSVTCRSESPVMWVRIDPECSWLRRVSVSGITSRRNHLLQRFCL